MIQKLPLKPFYFIRHGESEWNVLEKFAGGGVDTPLTDKGRAQAREAVDIMALLDPRPTQIIHSPLSRAAETARIVNEGLGLPMVVEDDLREVMAGDWEGLPFAVAKQRWAEGLTPEGGENLEMFAKRISDVFGRILRDDRYEMPFIAAHGRIINAFDVIYGVVKREFQVENCQILHFFPSEGRYPWDVYGFSVENGGLVRQVMPWCEI